MRGRDLGCLVIAMMLVSGLHVAATGVPAGLFGLYESVFHDYAGYVCAGPVLLHLALNWRRTTVYVAGLFEPRPAMDRPAEQGRASALYWAARDQ
jgi:hypothetical protein